MWSLTLVAVLLFPMVHLCYDKLRKSPGMQVAAKKSMHRVSRVYGRKTPGISFFLPNHPSCSLLSCHFWQPWLSVGLTVNAGSRSNMLTRNTFRWKLLTGLPSFSNTKDSQTTQERCKEDRKTRVWKAMSMWIIKDRVNLWK